MNQMHYMKISFVGSILLLLSVTLSFAQQNKPVKVQAQFDSSAVPELFARVPIGLVFTFSDNKKSATWGYLRGKVRWNRLKITSPQGTVKAGMLYFDPRKVWENGHMVDLKISYSDTLLFCELALPYLESIHFNLYTDSLKRDVEFYLNMEGHFSSGKIYPLDTVKVRFQASAGELLGNVLLLPESDTAVHDIQVKGIFKWDAQLADSCLIPVKTQVEDITLPTEQELLDRWKKERRRK